MKTILVWVLVTFNHAPYGYRTVSYSPVMSDLASCELLQTYVDMSNKNKPGNGTNTSQCVQIRVNQ
ncbi:MAG: hypothetical protein EBU90_14020 [Proteobacteria bacterium]|nr:hypothetical protein [Pseudomonadota bacterium]